MKQLGSLLGNKECAPVLSLYRVILFVAFDHGNEKCPVVLLQYLFKDDGHEVRCLNLHGNNKRKVPYRRTFPSTINKMKFSRESGKRPKYALDEVYRSLGDVSQVRSVGQIPRAHQDGQFQVKTLTVLQTRW